ncbi:MAG TPA: hypothetical protein VIT65_11995 [Microlunatus sp.]
MEETADDSTVGGAAEEGQEADPVDDPAEEQEEESGKEEDPLYHFGDTVTYENGLKVTIGKPTTLKNYAYPEDVEKGQKVIRFKITVDNQTDHRLDPSEFTMTASSGDDEAEFAIDSEHGLEGTPDTKILRGKKRSWDYGYIVTKGQDFVLEISPDYETEEAIFVS